MFINVIKSYRDIVAICDKELLGKTFEQGNHILDIKESFYKGKQFSETEAIQLMKSFSEEDATFNIVGKKSVAVALKEGIISKDIIKTVDNVPFALVLL